MTTSSFQRKCATTRPKISGTKCEGPEILISTGVTSLDEYIGGGLAVGSLLLIEEENHIAYGQLLTKYFIAEGVSHNHRTVLYPSDIPSQIILKNIPNAVERVKHVTPSTALASNEPLKIAWRYQQVEPAPLLLGSRNRLFDWNQILSEEKLSSVTSYKGHPTYSGILSHLANVVLSQHSSNQILRIVIHGLGSPLWEDEENVFRFLYALRCLCRSHNATCLITAPEFWLSQEPGRKGKVRCLVDVAVELHTLKDHEKEKRSHLKDYTGIIFFHRVRRPNSFFARTISNTKDLAFSIKRKNIFIEKIHLPPALDEGPTIKSKPSMACSARPGTSVLDF